jgi:His-Xaa-Ser system protein HxsD
MSGAPLPWSKVADDGSIVIDVDEGMYGSEVVARTCHAFTGRCFAFMSQGPHSIQVTLSPKTSGDDLRLLAGEFSNALLEQLLRVRIAAETQTIRELLVAQAFCEADLLDRRTVESEPANDVQRITNRR